VYLYTVGRTTFTGVNGVAGTDYADRLIGSEGCGIVSTVRAESFGPRGGNDTVEGMGSYDTVFYSSAPSAIQVSLTLATGQVVQDGWGTSDTLINIESLRGSICNDSFARSAAANLFKGEAGNDTIIGGEGSDLATYVGARTDYTAVFADGILTLTDTVSGRDGMDSVSEIGKFSFAGAIHLLHVVDGTGQSVLESTPT
jgi:Ca2+-binding RTX toxin-like protein